MIFLSHFWPLLKWASFLRKLGVNFINILHTNCSYECHFSSFFYIHVTREKLPKQHSYKKFIRKMLMKLIMGQQQTSARAKHQTTITKVTQFKFVKKLWNALSKKSNLVQKNIFLQFYCSILSFIWLTPASEKSCTFYDWFLLSFSRRFFWLANVDTNSSFRRAG